jgi:hypothetical protein
MFPKSSLPSPKGYGGIRSRRTAVRWRRPRAPQKMGFVRRVRNPSTKSRYHPSSTVANSRPRTRVSACRIGRLLSTGNSDQATALGIATTESRRFAPLSSSPLDRRSR